MKNDKHIIGLDSMRGLAILMVCVYHMFESFFRGYPAFDTNGVLQFPPIYPEAAKYFFDFNMRLSIHLFFVVSGYIIHALYSQKTFDIPATKTFVLKRYFRMAPAYYVSIIIAVVGAVVVGRLAIIDYKDILVHVLFIHNFFDQYSYSIQSLYWTMGIEFQFYLLYAILRLVLKEKFDITYIFIFSLLLSFGIRLFYYEPALAEELRWQFMDNTLIRFSDWLMGAILFEHRKLIFKIPYKLVLFFILILVASYMDNFGFASNVFLDFVSALGMLFLVAHVLQYQIEPKSLKFVGIMSYSFYLYHFVTYSIFDTLCSRIFGYDRVASWERLGIFVIGFILTLVVGYSMYKLIEEPAVKFFKQKLK